METVSYKISELIPAEYNPRRLTDKEWRDLRESLRQFGVTQPAVVNTAPGRERVIIGGHQRIKAWASLGRAEFPCFEVSLDLAREKELNIRLNKAGGSFDMDKLANLFSTDDLIAWGFEDFELGLGEVGSLEGESEGVESGKGKKVKTCPHCDGILP